MGAQASATRNLDHDDGAEKAFGCLNATPRDYAKPGRLVLNDGRVEGKLDASTGCARVQVDGGTWVGSDGVRGVQAVAPAGGSSSSGRL
jgi:CubicO group peptidase (beta-lactamase class C family)